MIRMLLICSLLIATFSCSNPTSTQPSKQYEFTTESISFRSDTFNLLGSIDVPKYEGNKPAIIIIPGSGPIDRDGSTLEKPIYRIWSNYFAKNGFVSLRFDKRFLTYKNLTYKDINESTQITDAEAAVMYIQSRPDVDKNRVNMLGHSEGGSIVPSVSMKVNSLRGIVLVSASAIPIDSLFIIQLQSNPAIPISFISQVKLDFTLLHNGSYPDSIPVVGASKQYWLEWIEMTTKSDSIVLGQSSKILYIQGLNDETLPGNTGSDNFERWRNTAAKSNGKVQVKVYPGITHLLLNQTTRDTSETILVDIVNWLRK